MQMKGFEEDDVKLGSTELIKLNHIPISIPLSRRLRPTSVMCIITSS